MKDLLDKLKAPDTNPGAGKDPSPLPAYPSDPKDPAARKKWNAERERERLAEKAARKRGERTGRAFPNPR